VYKIEEKTKSIIVPKIVLASELNFEEFFILKNVKIEFISKTKYIIFSRKSNDCPQNKSSISCTLLIKME